MKALRKITQYGIPILFGVAYLALSGARYMHNSKDPRNDLVPDAAQVEVWEERNDRLYREMLGTAALTIGSFALASRRRKED
jgi:hypothetical protein